MHRTLESLESVLNHFYQEEGEQEQEQEQAQQQQQR